MAFKVWLLKNNTALSSHLTQYGPNQPQLRPYAANTAVSVCALRYFCICSLFSYQLGSTLLNRMTQLSFDRALPTKTRLLRFLMGNVVLDKLNPNYNEARQLGFISWFPDMYRASTIEKHIPESDKQSHVKEYCVRTVVVWNAFYRWIYSIIQCLTSS